MSWSGRYLFSDTNELGSTSANSLVEENKIYSLSLSTICKTTQEDQYMLDQVFMLQKKTHTSVFKFMRFFTHILLESSHSSLRLQKKSNLIQKKKIYIQDKLKIVKENVKKQEVQQKCHICVFAHWTFFYFIRMNCFPSHDKRYIFYYFMKLQNAQCTSQHLINICQFS